MRVGIDARLVYYRQAGISQYTVRLLEELAAIDKEDEFTVFQSRRQLSKLVDQPNFRRRSLWTPPHHRLEQFLLPLELTMVDLDVLHSPDFIPPFRRNCKSVITVHDLNFLLFPDFLTPESASYYAQIDQAVRNCDHIIAVSESTKQDLIQLTGAPENKITVVYEAAHPNFHPLEDPEKSELRARLGLSKDYILFVSTIEPRKNVPTLLKAYRKLLDEYRPDISLVLAGEKGWLSDEPDWCSNCTWRLTCAFWDRSHQTIWWGCITARRCSSIRPSTKDSACRHWRPWPAARPWWSPTPQRCRRLWVMLRYWWNRLTSIS
jgi:glycosyltransferase involved in cell wall biosynthesis